MFFPTKKVFFYAVAAMVCFTAGWACNKYGNNAGISDNTVVATVNGHDITFRDWMRQMDLLRVFASPIDPDNKDQVKAVLDSLIDQQVVLDAAQKDHYSNASFDETVKTRLQAADLKVKELKEKLEKDIQTVERIQGSYQDAYKKMLLARQFASSQVDKVVVTNKDLKDWYDQYAAQAAEAGQKLPPFDKVKDRLKPDVQAEKFVKDLETASTIDRKNDVINKYLNNLSISDKILNTDEKVEQAPAPQEKDGKKDPKAGKN